jgi:hypothetical protein
MDSLALRKHKQGKNNRKANQQLENDPFIVIFYK